MAERRENNSGRSSSMYVMVVVALLLLAVMVGLGLFFNIETINVEGATVYPVKEIIEASGIGLDQNIMFISESSAAVRIKNSFAYIDEVRIERSLPNTVTIHVTETPPVAYVEYSGSYWIVNSNCKILERVQSLDSKRLIRLLGIEPRLPAVGEVISLGEGNAVRQQYLQDVLSGLDRLGLCPLIDWLDLTNISAVTFRYDGRITVELGRGDDVADKLWLMQKIVELHPYERGATIDLTIPGEGHYIPG